MIYFSANGFSREPTGAVTALTAPVFEANGREIPFLEEDGDFAYRAGLLAAKDEIEPLGDGLYLVTRTVENTGRTARTGKLIAEICDRFAAQKSCIPCVMFDGNEISGGKEPHGFIQNGEPWVFSYDRCGIPSCTEAEDEHTVCALFASDKNADSLVSACALLPGEGGALRHRIYYPVTEAPFSYIDHDIMGERYDTYLTIAPGERFTVEFYIYIGKPKWKNFGMASLLDRIHTVFPFRHEPALTVREVHDAAINHCKVFLCDYSGAKMFRNAMRNDPNSDGLYMPYPVYEAGWSGQCLKQARMFINEYANGGAREYLETGLSCLDAWVKAQGENGLFPINYARHISKNYVPCDVCNYGWAAAEMSKSYTLLHTLGIERPLYLEFAERLCDFFLMHYDEKTGFGLKWNLDGTKAADGGSIGAFMIMGLIETYKAGGKPRFLDGATRAMELYAARDIDNFVCTAGAIDCACIDKETAYPFIVSALDLYEIQGKTRYLEIAEKAAYYFHSWTFYYDALYDGDSDFERLGYYTSGGTAVSTQHPAIDPWGAIVIPDYMRLAAYTGDERWRARARALWCNCILCITPPGGMTLHGHKRPAGLQSEAFFQTRWTRYRKSCEERGHLNDMFVGWPAAFRLTTIDRIERELGGDFCVIEKEEKSNV